MGHSSWMSHPVPQHFRMGWRLQNGSSAWDIVHGCPKASEDRIMHPILHEDGMDNGDWG